jgi:hypothetical protein
MRSPGGEDHGEFFETKSAVLLDFHNVIQGNITQEFQGRYVYSFC